MKNASRYFGLAAIVVVLLQFVLLFFIHSPNLTEPLSQYGYYQDTQLIFGLGLTIAALLIYLFSRNLDVYWSQTSRVNLIAGVFASITGWATYEPYVKTFVFDVHNIAVILSVMFYALPMIMISYNRVHGNIAKASRYLFFVTTILVAVSFVARATNTAIIYAQVLAIIPTQIWLFICSMVVLRHQRGFKKQPILESD